MLARGPLADRTSTSSFTPRAEDHIRPYNDKVDRAQMRTAD